MLKTNSKKARENIKNYIVENFSAENYTDTPPTDWHGIAEFIYNTFRQEKYNCLQDYQYYNRNEHFAFFDWCAGLPSVLDTCYFYNRSAIRDLADILEQTIKDSLKKYTEDQAERQLTALIYYTIKKELEK